MNWITNVTFKTFFKSCLSPSSWSGFFFNWRENLTQLNPLCSKLWIFLQDFQSQNHSNDFPAAFCFSLILLHCKCSLRAWTTALWNLNGAGVTHDKQISQVNQRPPSSPAMWHTQVFILQNNNKVCTVTIKPLRHCCSVLANLKDGRCGI